VALANCITCALAGVIDCGHQWSAKCLQHQLHRCTERRYRASGGMGIGHQGTLTAEVSATWRRLGVPRFAAAAVQLALPHQEFPISQDWRLVNCRRRPPRSMWSRASFTLSCPIQVPTRPSVPRAIPCSPSPPVRASLPVHNERQQARTAS